MVRWISTRRNIRPPSSSTSRILFPLLKCVHEQTYKSYHINHKTYRCVLFAYPTPNIASACSPMRWRLMEAEARQKPQKLSNRKTKSVKCCSAWDKSHVHTLYFDDKHQKHTIERAHHETLNEKHGINPKVVDFSGCTCCFHNGWDLWKHWEK